MLLAEHPGTRLTGRLLRAVLGDRAREWPERLGDVRVGDWDAFRAAHPWVSGREEDWRGRLARACAESVNGSARPTS